MPFGRLREPVRALRARATRVIVDGERRPTVAGRVAPAPPRLHAAPHARRAGAARARAAVARAAAGRSSPWPASPQPDALPRALDGGRLDASRDCWRFAITIAYGRRDLERIAARRARDGRDGVADDREGRRAAAAAAAAAGADRRRAARRRRSSRPATFRAVAVRSAARGARVTRRRRCAIASSTALVVGRARASCGVLPDAAVARRWARSIGLVVLRRSIARHRRLAVAPAARGVSRRGRRPSAARSRARRSRTSAGCSSALLQFSTLTPDADARARRVRGRGARARGARGGQGRDHLHRALRLLGAAGPRAALVLPPMSVLARPLDNPYLHELLEQHAHARPATA